MIKFHSNGWLCPRNLKSPQPSALPYQIVSQVEDLFQILWLDFNCIDINDIGLVILEPIVRA